MDYSAIPSNELLLLCANSGGAAVWEEFIRRFNPLISKVAFRVATRFGESSTSVVDDLIQETYLKIYANECKLLKAFEPKGPESIFGFLKVVASNVAHDYFKSLYAKKRGAGEANEPLDDVTTSTNSSSSQGSPAQIERAILFKQIDRHLCGVLLPSEVKRARMVFWLYYRAGLSANAIASLPTVGLTTKGVESLLFRLTKIVRESLTDAPSSNRSASEKGLRQPESF